MLISTFFLVYKFKVSPNVHHDQPVIVRERLDTVEPKRPGAMENFLRRRVHLDRHRPSGVLLLVEVMETDKLDNVPLMPLHDNTPGAMQFFLISLSSVYHKGKVLIDCSNFRIVSSHSPLILLNRTVQLISFASASRHIHRQR